MSKRRPRRKLTAKFKAQVALAAVKGERRWPSYRSISRYTRTRSVLGSSSFKVRLQPYLRHPSSGGKRRHDRTS